MLITLYKHVVDDEELTEIVVNDSGVILSVYGDRTYSITEMIFKFSRILEVIKSQGWKTNNTWTLDVGGVKHEHVFSDLLMGS